MEQKSKSTGVNTMSKKTESFRANLETLATDHATKSALHAANVAEGLNAETESKKAKRHATHARYDAKVAGMTDAGITVALRFGMTPDIINEQSREYKKRLIGICEAIAANNRGLLDNAADAMLCAMVDGTADEYSLAYLQHQAQHEGTTQAGYMRTALTMLGCATKTKGAFILNRNAKVWAAIVSLYGKLPAPPAEITVNE
jgi:hypothetical protein